MHIGFAQAIASTHQSLAALPSTDALVPWIVLMISIAAAGVSIIYVRTKAQK